MDPQLVDRIYECAFVPEMWPDVLHDLARIATARTGFLCVSDGKNSRTTASNLAARLAISTFFANEMPWNSMLVTGASALGFDAFYREIDYPQAKGMTAEEIRDSGQGDFLYRQLCARGLGWGAAALANLPTQNRLYFAFARACWDLGFSYELVCDSSF